MRVCPMNGTLNLMEYVKKKIPHNMNKNGIDDMPTCPLSMDNQTPSSRYLIGSDNQI